MEQWGIGMMGGWNSGRQRAKGERHRTEEDGKLEAGMLEGCGLGGKSLAGALE